MLVDDSRRVDIGKLEKIGNLRLAHRRRSPSAGALRGALAYKKRQLRRRRARRSMERSQRRSLHFAYVCNSSTFEQNSTMLNLHHKNNNKNQEILRSKQNKKYAILLFH